MESQLRLLLPIKLHFPLGKKKPLSITVSKQSWQSEQCHGQSPAPTAAGQDSRNVSPKTTINSSIPQKERAQTLLMHPNKTNREQTNPLPAGSCRLLREAHEEELSPGHH